jgi:1-acyl-sn-glycerol-3-phosphate acyltransferase
MQCRAPVIPVAQLGTAAVQPIGALWPKLFRPVKLRMGRPLRWDGSSIDGTAPAVSDQREFTDEIMRAIQQLSGQDHVDVYAKRDKGRLSAPGSEAEPVPARS